MKLTGPVLADIYLGKIKSWNDKAITDLNPGLKPSTELITVVRRSDGSGTTFNFTDYLSKVSDEWKSKVGSSTAVAWPEGVGGKGNEGVAAYVQRIKGSIGYVEYAYAKKNNLTLHAGAEQGRPVSEAGQRHLPGRGGLCRLEACNRLLSDHHQFAGAKTPGRSPRPASSCCTPRRTSPQNAAEVLKFFDWSFKNGQKMAEELDYVPLPDSLTKLIADGVEVADQGRLRQAGLELARASRPRQDGLMDGD